MTGAVVAVGPRRARGIAVRASGLDKPLLSVGVEEIASQRRDHGEGDEPQRDPEIIHVEGLRPRQRHLVSNLNDASSGAPEAGGVNEDVANRRCSREAAVRARRTSAD